MIHRRGGGRRTYHNLRSWQVAVISLVVCCCTSNRSAWAGGPTTGTTSSSQSSSSSSAASSSSSSSSTAPRVYPQRHQEEAAVIEWGHSAIISALDAVVADFGPQTSQAALLEVETAPVLASPITGIDLQNGHDLFGNVAIVVDTHLSGYEAAWLCQSHGAAAVIVVHADPDHPDDAPRLFAPQNYHHTAAAAAADNNKNQETQQGSRTIIDIPVVSISWTAANVLTTALLPEDERQQEFGSDTLSALGLPDRIRLYAGEDRPFFEDIEVANPTVYLIHNLLTASEADQLVTSMGPLVAPIRHEDCLHYTDDITYTQRSTTERAVQWSGMMPSFFPNQKNIVERIGQVTGFPAVHVSDFIVDKVSSGDWERHYDSLLRTYVPLASITVFLNDHDTAVWKFPLTKRGGDGNNNNNNSAAAGGSVNNDGPEIHIQPRKGMAIVHHNTDHETQRFDPYALYSLDMNGSRTPLYMARKIVLPVPPGLGRRVLLPLVAMVNGGRLPSAFSRWYETLLDQYGAEDGPRYFDWALVIVPTVLLLLVALIIIFLVVRRTRTTTTLQPPPLNGNREDKKSK